MTAERTFGTAAEAVGEARRFVADELSHLDPEVVSTAMLLVSELATNAIRHAASRFRVRVARLREHVRVEVTDAGVGLPELQPVSAMGVGGRGLRIVDSLAASWGVTGSTPPKTVWFTLPC